MFCNGAWIINNQILRNGETTDEIAKRKGLRYREDILDNMGSEELAANLFRITQTESRLKRDKVDTENKANKTHTQTYFLILLNLASPIPLTFFKSSIDLNFPFSFL